MIGSRFGKYEILDKLGEGGMGEVWRARDTQLHRTVALKILPPEVARDPARRARFEQEARALAALNHPNIVAVYEFGEDQGRVFLVSELVEGESLRALLDKGKLPLRRATDIGIQIADAIAAAHAAAIVHRDLKPENIMLTHAGAVKVLDFGLAKQAPAPGPADATVTMGALTQPGTVMGTVGYMSPEQVRGIATDHRSDIFSLGVVLFEMLAGRRAFQADSPVETMSAILNLDPVEPLIETQGIPPNLAVIVKRCLEKRPEQRFQSAADLAFALRSTTATVTSASGTVPILKTPEPPPARRRWLWAVVAGAGTAALFGAGFLLRDHASPQVTPEFKQITFRRGLVSNARFSSDGRSVVYAAYWDSSPGHIFLANPGDPESRDLGLPDDSKLLSVSVNGEVAFSHPPFADDATGTLIRGSLSGGQMRPWLEGVYAADWSPDGSSLAIVRKVDGKFRLEYPVGKILADNLDYAYPAIRVSPDGSRVAFAGYAGGSAMGIGFYDASGKKQWLGPVSGQTTGGVDAHLSWSPDGREIWFRSFDQKEAGTIFAIDLNGRKRLVTRIPGHATVLDIARDGRVLVRTESTQQGIIAKAPGDAAERDLSVLDSSLLAGISDDGSVIATSDFAESGGPKGSVYIRKLDGSQAIRVGDGRAFVFSPDGKWISGYSSSTGTDRQFKLLPTGAGEERTPQFPGLKVGIVFGWLPGDRQYLVVGAENGKKWQCFAADMLHNLVRPVCPEGIPDDLVWASPDGKWVLSQAPGGGHYTAYPVAGGDSKLVLGMTPDDTPIGWRADSHSIYVTDNAANITIVDLVTGKRAPWGKIHAQRPVDESYNVRITPDGRSYAYTYVVRTSDLYIASGLK